jgi:hypothetical protein
VGWSTWLLGAVTAADTHVGSIVFCVQHSRTRGPLRTNASAPQLAANASYSTVSSAAMRSSRAVMFGRLTADLLVMPVGSGTLDDGVHT